MTVMRCAKCPRLISISILPGGNPVALANPEIWAINFGLCLSCRRHYCDRCIRDVEICPSCGGNIELHKPGDAYAISEMLSKLK